MREVEEFRFAGLQRLGQPSGSGAGLPQAETKAELGRKRRFVQ